MITPFILPMGDNSNNLISNFMNKLEKLTNLILAIGTVLTAAASIYKQYNEDKKEVKLNDCTQN